MKFFVKRYSFFILLFILFFSLFALSAYAAPLNFDLNKPISTATGSIGQYIARLYDVGIAFAGAAAFIGILIGGLEYTVSAGNPGKMEDAKDRIKQAVFGIVLLFGAVVLFNTINPDIVQLTKPGVQPGSFEQRFQSVQIPLPN